MFSLHNYLGILQVILVKILIFYTNKMRNKRVNNSLYSIITKYVIHCRYLHTMYTCSSKRGFKIIVRKTLEL